MKLAFSPAAVTDLMDIAIYIAQDNPSRALTFVDELEHQRERLSGAPGIGTSRPALGNGVRVLPHKRYLIFYRANSKEVRIERILHGARDIGSDDFESPEPAPRD